MQILKNKKILILFCVLVGVAALAVLSGVLFSVQHIEVRLSNAAFELKSTQMEESLEDLRGRNILALNETEIADRLEEAYPYAEVLRIERVFPSRVVVHVAERYEVYAVQSGDVFLHTDRNGRILRISDSPASNLPLETAADNIVVRTAEGTASGEVGQAVSFSYAFQSDLLYQLWLQTTHLPDGESAQEAMTVFEYRQFLEEVDLTLPTNADVLTREGARFRLLSYQDHTGEFCALVYRDIYLTKLTDASMRANSEVNIYLENQRLTYTISR